MQMRFVVLPLLNEYDDDDDDDDDDADGLAIFALSL